jgi:sterol desaturase/sphingolipid hydroxylase (fatty acid hydroxylase superfamily)
MFFFLSYEWLHLSYHLPKESFIGRLGIVALLREHHRRHHDPRLMKRWNFNVTVPVFDWIRGTVWSPEREAARDARRKERRAAAAHG